MKRAGLDSSYAAEVIPFICTEPYTGIVWHSICTSIRTAASFLVFNQQVISTIPLLLTSTSDDLGAQSDAS